MRSRSQAHHLGAKSDRAVVTVCGLVMESSVDGHVAKNGLPYRSESRATDRNRDRFV